MIVIRGEQLRWSNEPYTVMYEGSKPRQGGEGK